MRWPQYGYRQGCETKNFSPGKEVTLTGTVAKMMEKVIQIDETQIQKHTGELVCGTVEETLNILRDAEADQLCNLARYERTDAGKDQRAGHFQRKPYQGR